MPSEPVQHQIDALLHEAEAAILRSEWALVWARAQQVLRLDPENRDGRLYLTAAERGLSAEQPGAASPAPPPVPNGPADAVTPTQPPSAGEDHRPTRRIAGQIDLSVDAATAERVLLANEVFAEADPEVLLDVVTELTRNTWITQRRVPAGTSVVREGDPGDTLYVLSEGSLRVTVDDGNGGATEVGRLQPGAVFGEMAFLLNRRRSATVWADADAAILVLPAHAWKHLSIRIPNTTKRLERIIAQRGGPPATDS